MRNLAGWLMAVNGVVFFFGAVQHAGVTIGPFHEPLILPAAIVETVCGVSLLWGAAALFSGWKRSREVALIANSIALSGVLLGIAALAVGAGPRTASNDLYHRVMLLLIFAASVLLVIERSRMKAASSGLRPTQSSKQR